MNLTELQPGRYTVVGYTDFGFLYQQHINLREVQETKYAQYDKTHKMLFSEKGGRTTWMKYILPDQHLAVWSGWVNPDTGMWGNRRGNVTESKYTSFDDRYIRDAIRSVQQEPVYARIERSVQN